MVEFDPDNEKQSEADKAWAEAQEALNEAQEKVEEARKNLVKAKLDARPEQTSYNSEPADYVAQDDYGTRYKPTEDDVTAHLTDEAHSEDRDREKAEARKQKESEVGSGKVGGETPKTANSSAK